MSFWDAMSLLGSLLMIVLVLVLTWAATRWYARRMRQSGSGRHIKVIEKSPLGTGTALALVQVGQQYYLLGVGDKKVSLISPLADFQPEEGEPSSQPPPFSQMFGDLLAKAKQKGQKGGDDRDGGEDA